jgi:polyisoprenoid-binding protein YceI
MECRLAILVAYDAKSHRQQQNIRNIVMKLFSPKTLLTAMLVAAAAVATSTALQFPNAHGQGQRLASLATNEYKLQPTGAVAMRLTGTLNLFGTSTLHNWEMSAHQLQGSAQFDIENGQLSAVSALTFILPVKNLKGDKDGMNDNAYDALKADKYKDIRFVMSNSRLESNGGGKYTIHANGNLTIAGATRPIVMDVKAQVNSDGTVGCTGTYALKMSEYNIDRPSFMFGAMKTGDALTLSYSLVFVK